VRYPATSAPVFDDGPSTDGCVAETNSENSVAAVADKVHLLDSTLQLADSTVTATVRICRSANRRKEFTPRAIAIVNFFHAEMNWIYQADIVLTSADAMALAPRARQTLELLLAGLGEKQIASKLGLSPNTVHHYVKSIHRHFGVSSRSELLARWVGK
jgi:DNA-binding NarL/FixJ family response regulator